jgi:hypothetical protein
MHQPQERVQGSSVAATPFENITRMPSVPPTPTSKLPTQEVVALRRMGRLDGDTFLPKVINKPLRNPQVASLKRRGITGCFQVTFEFVQSERSRSRFN